MPRKGTVFRGDRDCAKWMADYAINGAAGLRLHHFYRAMAWLGGELAPAGEGDLAPYCIEGIIGERLFERRRNLFSDLSLVFMDTTSPSFYGAGGGLGAHGYSRDHRPDLKQMVLAVVIDGAGRPLCTEMMAGNTADSTVPAPVIERLRRRFHIGRVCVIADRGMISAATIRALEARKQAVLCYRDLLRVEEQFRRCGHTGACVLLVSGACSTAGGDRQLPHGGACGRVGRPDAGSGPPSAS